LTEQPGAISRSGSDTGARRPDPAFWRGKRVLLTGHTGFKGAWLTLWLQSMQAQVFGLALEPESSPALFDLLAPWTSLDSRIGDIRDRGGVIEAVENAKPELAIHMAAQAFVRRSYRDPLGTFATNVMGTANILEALRESADLRAALVVTTDKVYRNPEDGRPFAEGDPLGGHDPYSASKAACELAVQSWAASYYAPRGVAVATVRGGNVVGGGDWSEDRLVPDLIRAAKGGRAVELRYPDAARPWQHVLDCLAGYLLFAEDLALRPAATPRALNIGPVADDEVSVSRTAEIVGASLGAPPWTRSAGPHPPEMTKLALDSTAARQALGYRQRLTSVEALEWAVGWYTAVENGVAARDQCVSEIHRYLALPGIRRVDTPA
jgi:CDP-glucose 4,6-dehydratase